MGTFRGGARAGRAAVTVVTLAAFVPACFATSERTINGIEQRQLRKLGSDPVLRREVVVGEVEVGAGGTLRLPVAVASTCAGQFHMVMERWRREERKPSRFTRRLPFFTCLGLGGCLLGPAAIILDASLPGERSNHVMTT